MSLQNKLEGLRSKKVAELDEIYAQIAELEGRAREAQSYLQALQDSIRLLLKNEGNGSSKEARIKPGSNPDKVYALLKKAGHPLHIKTIVEGIGLQYSKMTRSTINSALIPYLKKGQVFTRPEPGTYGLVEWEASQSGNKTSTSLELEL